MTEAKLEALLCAKISALELDGLAVISTWGTADQGKVAAALEDPSAIVVETNMLPRAYDTFTIPYAAISGSVRLSVSPANDPTRSRFLAASDSIMALFAGWQKSISTVVSDFSISSEFTPVGFRLAGGETDMEGDEWALTISFVIQGVVLN